MRERRRRIESRILAQRDTLRRETMERHGRSRFLTRRPIDDLIMDDPLSNFELGSLYRLPSPRPSNFGLESAEAQGSRPEAAT